MNATQAAAFVRSMAEIRERVRREKARGAPVRAKRRPVKTMAAIRTPVKDKSPSMLKKQFARFKRRSRLFTDSSYAKALRWWWTSQDRFIRRIELAAFLGVDSETVSSWFTSKKFPQEEMCDTLYSLTNVACFSREQRRDARREHNLNRAKKGLRRSSRHEHRANSGMGAEQLQIAG
jgi:hypothetical protein